MMRTLVTCVLSACAVSVAAQQSVFRSGADVVTVDVAVHDGNKPIASLNAADFELRDNNALQTIADVQYGTVPVDVRVLVDLSGSITADQLQRHNVAIEQMQRVLTKDDRIEIATFARRVVLRSPLHAPPIDIALARHDFDGTSFYDAALLAMMPLPAPGRRQMTVLITDGADSASFFDDRALLDAVKRTDAVVNIVTAVDGLVSAQGIARFTRFTSPTGGQFIPFPKRGDIGATLTQMMADFRQTYVLTYTPSSASAGWHAIAVSVPKLRSASIRARQGYFGG